MSRTRRARIDRYLDKIRNEPELIIVGVRKGNTLYASTFSWVASSVEFGLVFLSNSVQRASLVKV